MLKRRRKALQSILRPLQRTLKLQQMMPSISSSKSSIKLNDLLKTIRAGNESRTIRIFTIGYDAGGGKDVLQQIADATQGKFYEATPENIREVLRDIGSFF